MIATVWFVGTSGVGKTTVGLQLRSVLERRGTRTAFIDADQLRNVGGVDATEDELIADGLRAISLEFERAGAGLLVVSGIVDDDAHLARLLPEASRADVLVVYLHAADETVIDRVVRRQWNVGFANDSVEYARNFNPEWVDVTVDTTQLLPEQIVKTLLERVEAVVKSPRVRPHSAPTTGSSASAALTVVTGAGGVGLSTVGFLTFLQGMGGGERIGYIDSHQVGFIGRDSRSTDLAELKARNSLSIAAVMARHGVEHVVITGDPATSRSLVELAQPRSVFWLDASDPTIETRHRARAAGGGPPLAGDHRIGLGEDDIRAGIAAALLEARDDSIRPPGHALIKTDHTSAEDVASQITAARTG